MDAAAADHPAVVVPAIARTNQTPQHTVSRHSPSKWNVNATLPTAPSAPPPTTAL